MELSEIVTAIGTFVGGDKAKAKEVSDALRADAGAKPVAQELINQGNSHKTAELKPRLEKLEADLKAANETIAERDASITELQSKAPDAKSIEEKAKAKYEPQLAKLTKERDEAITGRKALTRQVAKGKFASLLKEPDEKGVFVEHDWADKVVSAEFDDRFVEREDGNLQVLQIGETNPYDGKTLDDQIAALAADARKKVNAKYLITSTDSGGGVGGGGGGSATKTVEKIADSKAKSGDYGL